MKECIKLTLASLHNPIHWPPPQAYTSLSTWIIRTDWGSREIFSYHRRKIAFSSFFDSFSFPLPETRKGKTLFSLSPHSLYSLHWYPYYSMTALPPFPSHPNFFILLPYPLEKPIYASHSHNSVNHTYPMAHPFPSIYTRFPKLRATFCFPFIVNNIRFGNGRKNLLFPYNLNSVNDELSKFQAIFFNLWGLGSNHL